MTKSINVFMILVLVISLSKICAQKTTPYFTNFNDQKFLSYLIYSGTINIQHPLCQPYTYLELYDNLKMESSKSINHWINNILKQVDVFQGSDTTKTMFIMEGTGEGNVNFSENKIRKDIRINPALGFFYKNFGMYYKFDANTAYLQDTLYFGSIGKMQEKNFSRASEAWMQIENKYMRVFAGRMSRNYGAINDNGVLLSNNPFSYDHFAFEMFNDRLKFTFLFSRLDDMMGYDIRDTLPVLSLSKRFMTFHRLDFSFNPKFHVAISESILFGGKDEVPMFQYLNPANVFFFSKMSDRKNFEEQSANALMSIDFLYKPTKNISWTSQFLIDDTDLKKSLREIYPDRLGITSKLVFTDFPKNTLVYLKYEKISNWTFNSFYTWGNYAFYGKSIGFPMHGFESIKMGIDIFDFYPFIASFEIAYQRYRKQDLNMPFIAQKTQFPFGNAENITYGNVEFTYYPYSCLSVTFGSTLNFFENYNFNHNISKVLLNIYASVRFNGILTHSW